MYPASVWRVQVRVGLDRQVHGIRLPSGSRVIVDL